VTQLKNTPAKSTSMADLMAKNKDAFTTLTKGQIIEGTVKKLTPQEILLDIGAKGDALVIEFDKQNLDNLLSMLKVGQKVKASVISPESEEGFPVVSLRGMLNNIIYSRFEDLTNSDTALKVLITDSTRGGYFAQTEEGTKGFLPNSQVVDSKNIIGKTIDVKIIEFDKNQKRVIFSQKALIFVMDPEELKKLVKKDDEVAGEVASITPYGLYLSVKLGKNTVEGFIHISEISYERINNLEGLFEVGDKVKAQVIEVDTDNRRVNLSIKRQEKDKFADIRNKYKLEDKIKGKVKDVRTRGVIVDLGEGISGFIPADSLSQKEYKKDDELSAEVTGFDDKRRFVLLSPVLKTVPVGYR